MGTIESRKFNEFNVFSVDEKTSFLHVNLSDDPSFYRGLVKYFLDETRLLAPFIKSVENIEMLEKKPIFYNTLYSPVVNEVIPVNVLRHDDRYSECQRLLFTLEPGDKTLIYFPTVTGIYKYVNEYISNEPCLDELDLPIQYFLAWAREEIHEDWCVIKAMERGYLIHNGQIPIHILLFIPLQ